MMGPSGTQIHFSRERCRDFSCRVQSYLVRKVSVQNVHWKMRFWVSVGLAMGGKRRFRWRPFLPIRLEPKEPKEPCVDFDRDDPCENAALEADRDDVNPDDVSWEMVEGAWNRDGLEPLLDPCPRRPRRGERCSSDASDGRSEWVTAITISAIAAGSFSGGEFLHRSRGLSSSHGLSTAIGIAIALVVVCT